MPRALLPDHYDGVQVFSGGAVGVPDDAAAARAQGWRTLAALHARIEDELERALQKQHGLSVSEYSVLDVLARRTTTTCG